MIVNLAAGEYEPLANMPYIMLVANTNWLNKNKQAATAIVARSGERWTLRTPIRRRRRKFSASASPTLTRKRLTPVSTQASLQRPKSPEITVEMAAKAIEFTNVASREPVKVTPQQIITEEIFRMAAQARK